MTTLQYSECIRDLKNGKPIKAQKEHKMCTKLVTKHEWEQDHLKDLPLDGMIILNSGERLCLVTSVKCYST